MLARTGLILAGLAIGLIVAEIGLRLAGFSFPRPAQRDDDRGTAYRPGVEWWQTQEGEAFVLINHDGFRDQQRPFTKPHGTIRIAVLGDSYVDALQVPEEGRFTELLEAGLDREGAFGGAEVEVLNFGVSGYGTAQELMTLRSRVWKYEPDVVILAFLPGNDLRNNYEPLQGDPGRPYFILRGEELVLDDSFRTSPDHLKTWRHKLGYFVVDNSRLAQLAYFARKNFKKRREVDRRNERARDHADAEASVELGLDALVYKPPVDADWQQAWDVTEAILKQMHREVRAKGAQFLVVTLTASAQVAPDPQARRAFAAPRSRRLVLRRDPSGRTGKEGRVSRRPLGARFRRVRGEPRRFLARLSQHRDGPRPLEPRGTPTGGRNPRDRNRAAIGRQGDPRLTCSVAN